MPRKPLKPPGLKACPSAPHRAVAGLLPVALGHACPDGLLTDLEISAPEKIAEIAIANQVHTVLASAFDNAPVLREAIPHDLWLYFQGMRAANRERNAKLKRQLRFIGEALSGRGIKAVVLKGGAEILVPLHADPGHRFVSDLDILVDPTIIETAKEILLDLGGIIGDEDNINWRDRHQLLPIEFPDWPAPVELHRSAGENASMLPARDILEEALPCDEVHLHIPSPRHRFIHLVTHAQLHHRGLRNKVISLRDCLDLEVMRSRLPDTVWREAEDAFSGARELQALRALEAVTEMVFDRGTAQDGAAGPGRLWAHNALAKFGRPEGRRFREGIGWFFWYLWLAASSSERRRNYIRTLGDREKLRAAAEFHRRRNKLIK